MVNEPIPGAVSEGIASIDPQVLYAHYLPVVLDTKPGGLSVLEQEEFKQRIDWIAGAGADLQFAQRTDQVRNFIERFIEAMKRRPLASQIADLTKKYKEEHVSAGSQIYYAGSLITDRLYPDTEKGYKDLDTEEPITATSQERKSGLFVVVWRGDEGHIKTRPILEKEPFWGKSGHHWIAEVGLPRNFFSQDTLRRLEAKQGRPLYEHHDKAEDLLLPADLLRGSFDLLEKTLDSSGNLDASIEIDASTLSVRNFERWARSYARCLSFRISREK